MSDFLPALYVVATPIGNRDDITLRALALLRAADLIACEDTRHSAPLLAHYGISRPRLVAVHEHNEATVGHQLVAAITAGQRVALITDAGTPGISDPGARACAAVRAAGLPVVPLPGANAAITAISVSGWTHSEHYFVGFLPSRSSARRKALLRLVHMPASIILYEAPHRIAATLTDIAACFPPTRALLIAREMTKRFEEIVLLTAASAPDWLNAQVERHKGEFVLAIAPSEANAVFADFREAARILALLQEELPPARAAKLAAAITGIDKDTLYHHALALHATVKGQ